MIIRLGELSLSAVVPLLAAFEAALVASLGIATPELNGKLAGLLNVLAAITIAPPELGATITAAIAVVANLQAAISGPTITLQATAIASLIAELNIQLGILTAAAALAIPSGVLSAYVYDGPSGQIGTELQSEITSSLPGAPAHTSALILATTDSAAWVAAGLVFRIT
jgi:hypothetical protein